MVVFMVGLGYKECCDSNRWGLRTKKVLQGLAEATNMALVATG